tara:strand:- start:83 stop:403 length:321 start_codon:yes stop_codon:yes gene_type:complete
MANEKPKLQDFIQSATKNVTEDRAATKALLMSLMKYMQVSEDRHKEVGLVAAKYLETLQRSNEQLVKLAALVHKKTSQSPDTMTEKDKQELFDIINSEQIEGESDV